MKDLRKPFGEIGVEFSRRWAQRRWDAVQRYGRIIGNYGRGEVDAATALQEWGRLVSEEAARYAEEAVELGSAYARLLGGVLGSEQPAASAVSRGPSLARFDLDVTGPVGGESTRSFLLDNKQAVPAEISFLISDFTGPAGTSPFHTAVEFVPARLSLRPHEEKTVMLRLSLDPVLFTAGQRYHARIVVEGHDGLEIGLHVLATAPDT